jgi:hypothetical protein
MDDLYRLLECAPDADVETLRAAAARQAALWSRRGSTAASVDARHHAERIAAAIHRAKETLLDTERRAVYDQTPRAALPGAGPRPPEDQRSCPHCREPIRTDARKCRWCNEWLDGHQPVVPAAPRRSFTLTGWVLFTIAAAGIGVAVTLAAGRPPAPLAPASAAPYVAAEPTDVPAEPAPEEPTPTPEPSPSPEAALDDNSVLVVDSDHLDVDIRSGDTLMTLARGFADTPPGLEDDPKAKWPALQRLVGNNGNRRDLFSGQHLRIGPASADSLRLKIVLAVQKFCRPRAEAGHPFPTLHYGRPTFGPGDFENNAMVILPSEQGAMRFLVYDPYSGDGDARRFTVIPESERDRHPSRAWDGRP